jgi:hypothetical protein
MKKLRLRPVFYFMILISLFLVGCKSNYSDNKDNIEIYQLIIHRIYSKDNSFGKAIDIKYLYIIKTTNDNVGDPQITKQPNQNISKEIMDGIEEKLTDIPPRVIWINGYSDVLQGDSAGMVKEGAIITLGNIRFENNTKVFVSISFHVSGLAAAGRTYILVKENNEWHIFGDTGVYWVSWN